MAGIGVSEEWLEEHGFERTGLNDWARNDWIHVETDLIHNPDTGGTWIQDLDTYAALYPRSGKELLLCVKLRTQPIRKGDAG